MSDGTLVPDSPRAEPRRNGGDRMAFAASAGGAALRGALLIGAAIIIGIVLLQVVDDGGGGSSGVKPDRTTTSAAGSTAPTTAGTGASTSTSQGGGQARPAGDVKVKVYNGSGVAGAAGNMSNKLKSAGYQTGDDPLKPADAPAQRQGTIVACKAGLEADAGPLAQQVGPTTKVEAFPNPAPAGADAADCIVILGT